jgi:hypothetical protein
MNIFKDMLAETDSLERSLKSFRFLKAGTEVAISVHLSRPKLIYHVKELADLEVDSDMPE